MEARDLAHSLLCSPERPSVFDRIGNQKKDQRPYNLLNASETSDLHGIKLGRLNTSYKRQKPVYCFFLTREDYVIFCDIICKVMKLGGKKETAEERRGTETTLQRIQAIF